MRRQKPLARGIIEHGEAGLGIQRRRERKGGREERREGGAGLVLVAGAASVVEPVPYTDLVTLRMHVSVMI